MTHANSRRVSSYQVVDVFTQRRLEGNPLAVFPDGAGLDDATMQSIARELRLPETVFVVKTTRADCAARLRIFTPMREIPFAGHPTVGTSFVLLENGSLGPDTEEFGLEERIGRVSVRVERGNEPLIWLKTPPIEDGPLFDRAVCAKALGMPDADLLDCQPQLLSAGNPTIFIALRDKQAVDRAWLDASGMAMLGKMDSTPPCIFVFAPTAEGAYSRMFAPAHGIAEDPATGSATGPLAAYMMRHHLAPTADGSRFISEQGTKMQRRSILYLQIHGERGVDGIEVGGYVTPLVRAEMQL